MDSGTAFTSVCINTALYLPWLMSQCLKNKVIVKRAIFKHISEAANVHHSAKKADLIINCTGLSAGKLGGVEDPNMVPARGQIVVVRNEPGIMCSTSGTDDGEDEACYIMQRAAGEPSRGVCRSLAEFINVDIRRWYNSRRLVPERELGLSVRSEPGEQDHEKSRGPVSRLDGRQRDRTFEYRPARGGLATYPAQRRETGEGTDRRRLDGAQLRPWRVWVSVLVRVLSGRSEAGGGGSGSEIEAVRAVCAVLIRGIMGLGKLVERC